MATTNYFTVNGRTVGESGPNGTIYYHTDALGSVTMTTDASANLLNTYRFGPSGALVSKNVTAPDPRYLWVGSLGYRSTMRSHSEYYVRARHYGVSSGRWSTFDPLWPAQKPYRYSNSNPSSAVDPTGANPEFKLSATKSTVNTFCSCDPPNYMDYRFRQTWKLTPLTADGWIIQQVYHYLTITGLGDSPDGVAPVTVTDSYVYYEAYEVKNGQIWQGPAHYGQKPGIDEYGEKRGKGECAYRHFIATKQAYFFKGASLDSSDGWKDQPATPYGMIRFWGPHLAGSSHYPKAWANPSSNNWPTKWWYDRDCHELNCPGSNYNKCGNS